MKAPTRLLVVMALGAVPGLLWVAPEEAQAKTGRKAGPVVVELFTAQGCSSCKEANQLIARLADRPGLIVLTWSVDYWDYLGWKDTFAQPEFAARQKAFAKHLGPEDVYTPQVVVNGKSQVSGDDAAGVEARIKGADPSARPGPKVRFAGAGRVSIGAGQPPGGRADVWLIRYDPRERDVEVKAGDNRGATVVHRNVAQQIVRLGIWKGRPALFKTPPAAAADNLASVVIVEGSRGGPILGAAQAKPRKS